MSNEQSQEAPKDRYQNLYQDLVDAGIPIDSHASDLYVKFTPETRATVEALLAKYPEHAKNTSTFENQRPDEKGQLWLEVNFAYQPFWEEAAAESDRKLSNEAEKVAAGLVDAFRGKVAIGEISDAQQADFQADLLAGSAQAEARNVGMSSTSDFKVGCKGHEKVLAILFAEAAKAFPVEVTEVATEESLVASSVKL